jgi:hypothetical protein
MRALLPLLLASAARALYFYIDGTTPKCFFEELPKDTMVVGHYKAEEWDDHRQAWWEHDGLSLYISVDVWTPSPKPTPFATRPLVCWPQLCACLDCRADSLLHRRSSTKTTG